MDSNHSDFDTSATALQLARRAGVVSHGTRMVPEEVPVAFSYGGSTHAVMMATPADLEDFAIGFSLTEGIVGSIDQLAEIDILQQGPGIDVQVRLADNREEALRARRRHMAGPVGCGLCGIESIEQAIRPVASVSAAGFPVLAADIVSAVRLLGDAQPLHQQTHAVHGAGFYIPGKDMIAIREDVGRHNALDKLIGAATRLGHRGQEGFVVVTSRISVEMVQKTATFGASALIAISAPTALAIRTAEASGMMLVALARGEDFAVFTESGRIVADPAAD